MNNYSNFSRDVQETIFAEKSVNIRNSYWNWMSKDRYSGVLDNNVQNGKKVQRRSTGKQ